MAAIGPHTPDRAALWQWALWLAVVAGLGQALLLASMRRFTDRLIFEPPDVVWMAPTINALIFGTAVAVLHVATLRLQSTVRVRVVTAVLLFLFLLGPVQATPGLHVYAGMLLAAGLAAVGARLVRAYQGVVNLVVRRSLPLLIATTIAIGSGLRLSHALEVRRGDRAAAAMPATAERLPNVLLIVLDTVRASHLGLYGYARETTPRLDAFARGGVAFERALATSSWTLPSHGTLFTGRYPHEISADWLRALDGREPTLAGRFASHGYHTAGFVGNLINTTRETGLGRGFIEYMDYPLSPAMVLNSSFLSRALLRPYRRVTGNNTALIHKSASDVNGEFLAWVQSHRSKPFFAFLNYFDAHAPISLPSPYNSRFGTGERAPDLEDREHPSADELRRVVDAYDSALTYLDDQMDQLFNTLAKQGLLDDTLVIVTSDHGEQLGEHGLVYHGNSLYRPALHVPLVIRFPGRVPAGSRVARPVTLADLPATIVSLAGLSGGDTAMPGRPLNGHWDGTGRQGEIGSPILTELTGEPSVPLWMPVSKGDMKSIVVNGLHYIRNGDGREELYDFERDTAEEHDLSGRPDAQANLASVRRALALALEARK